MEKILNVICCKFWSNECLFYRIEMIWLSVICLLTRGCSSASNGEVEEMMVEMGNMSVTVSQIIENTEETSNNRDLNPNSSILWTAIPVSKHDENSSLNISVDDDISADSTDNDRLSDFVSDFYEESLISSTENQASFDQIINDEMKKLESGSDSPIIDIDLSTQNTIEHKPTIIPQEPSIAIPCVSSPQNGDDISLFLPKLDTNQTIDNESSNYIDKGESTQIRVSTESSNIGFVPNNILEDLDSEIIIEKIESTPLPKQSEQLNITEHANDTLTSDISEVINPETIFDIDSTNSPEKIESTPLPKQSEQLNITEHANDTLTSDISEVINPETIFDIDSTSSPEKIESTPLPKQSEQLNIAEHANDSLTNDISEVINPETIFDIDSTSSPEKIESTPLPKQSEQLNIAEHANDSLTNDISEVINPETIFDIDSTNSPEKIGSTPLPKQSEQLNITEHANDTLTSDISEVINPETIFDIDSTSSPEKIESTPLPKQSEQLNITEHANDTLTSDISEIINPETIFDIDSTSSPEKIESTPLPKQSEQLNITEHANDSLTSDISEIINPETIFDIDSTASLENVESTQSPLSSEVLRNNENISSIISIDDIGTLLSDKSDNEESDKPPSTEMISSINDKASNCGPNQILDNDGSCVCQKGYFGDDPLTSRGCWTCTSKCHRDAICTHPGKCQCTEGLIGDGVTVCKVPSPLAKSISPSRASPGSIVLVQYSVESGFNPHSSYCRFGKIIVPGVLFANKSIGCKVPQENLGDTKVFVSFDSISWSKESLSINVSSDKPFYSKIPVIPGIAFIVLIAGFVSIKLFVQKKSPLSGNSHPLLTEKQKPFKEKNSDDGKKPRKRATHIL